jgi:hypothetical protein
MGVLADALDPQPPTAVEDRPGDDGTKDAAR